MRLLMLIVGASGAFAQPTPVLETFAGGSVFTFTGNGGPATSAALIAPYAIAADKAGNIYFSDLYFQQVFKITPDGKITLFAGSGDTTYTGDGGPATQAGFDNPQALTVDPSGNVYITDNYWAVIRMVDTKGIIHTFAGTPTAFPGTGDGGPATAAGFAAPDGLASDSSGNIYIADGGPGSKSIREVNTAGIISRIAGEYGYHGVEVTGPALDSVLETPEGLTFDSSGNLYLADPSGGCGVYQINTAQYLSLFAGDNTCGYNGDSHQATQEALNLPAYVAFGPPNNLYITDQLNQRVRMVAGGIMTTIAGTGTAGYNGDNISAAGAQIASPQGIAADNSGNVYFAETSGRRIRKVSNGIITTIAGVGANVPMGDGGMATSAYFLADSGIVSDGRGTFYVADNNNDTIRKIAPDGTITTIAGTGVPGYNGDGIPAVQAQLYAPFALALDQQGNLYVSDSRNERVRMINTQGIISTVAGTGTLGYNGDGQPANQAQLATPRGIAFDSKGNLYICDVDNHRLRMVSGGTISTIAGVTGQTDVYPSTDSGDGGPAIEARFQYLWGVAIDSEDNIYTADDGSYRVRKITPDGNIHAFAGMSQLVGNSGDGGPATAATLSDATSLAADASGNVYISTKDRVRKVTTDGVIHTAIGGGNEYAFGNGQIATGVVLGAPYQMWFAPDGSMYLADAGDVAVFHYLPGQISREGMQNVANFAGSQSVAPGEIIVMYGSSLGPATLTTPTFTSSSTAFPTNIAGTEVLFDSTPAPLIYVESGVVALVVPFEVAGKTVTHVQASINGTLTNEVDFGVVPVSPGMWPSAVNFDGSINSASNPDPAGKVISFYLSGAGVTNPALSDGQFVEDNAHLLAAQVVVTIGGQKATIIYAGAAPDSIAGQVQIVAQIPSGIAPSSSVPVTVTVGGVSAAPQYSIAVN